MKSFSFCLLSAVAMALGWGVRGTFGHEAGAMMAGGLLGMAVCLASGRPDWYRRTAVAGLAGAVGWAWGGSLSYMEHTKYSLSDSFPDALYGYSILFFLGALWAGIGGAILGLAFTLPRSELKKFVGPLTLMGASFALVYLYFLFNPEQANAYEDFTILNFHDGDWLAATITLVISGIYWVVRPRDRSATNLFLFGSIAWWIGYGGLTKIGGLLLAPPFRSESWSGVLGVLIYLLLHLSRSKNRAALMLAQYGLLAGGIGFVLAVFLRHPFEADWAFLADWKNKTPWKVAEESFGFFMGWGMAYGAWTLLRGGLKPAEEDEPRTRFDVFSVFVVLVAVMWMNLRRVPMDWIHRYESAPKEPLWGMDPWVWYTLVGCALTAIAIYMLALYRKGNLPLAPSTAFGKGLVLFLALLWLQTLGSVMQRITDRENIARLIVDLSFIALASLATLLALSRGREAITAAIPQAATVDPSDNRWKVGAKYWFLWGLSPIVILAVTVLSMAMQEGPHPDLGRKRFGPDAYWRQQEEAGKTDRRGLLPHGVPIPDTN